MTSQFNSSAAVGFLPPLRDAQHYMKLLAEKHGYKFVAVTSLHSDPYAQETGMKFGFQGFLIEHGHNLNYTGSATVVKNWEQIYDTLTKGS